MSQDNFDLRNIQYINPKLGTKPTDKKSHANIFIWQNIIHESHFMEHFNYIKQNALKDQPDKLLDIEYVRIVNILAELDRLKKTLELEDDVDLVVLPELSVSSAGVELLKAWSKEHTNTIIIAGSHYVKAKDNKCRSMAPIITKGEVHPAYKIRISPEEQKIKDVEIIPGQQVFDYSNTPIGNFRIMICSDAIDDSFVENFIAKSKKRGPSKKHQKDFPYDFVIIISCQRNPDDIERQYGYADRIYNATSGKPYVVFSNIFSSGISSGKSALFGSIFAKDRKELRESLHAGNDGSLFPSFIVAMPDESRYMLLRVRLSERNSGNNRKVADGLPVELRHIEGKRFSIKTDEHSIKLAVFDLDGTLIQGATHYSWMLVYKALGIDDEIRKKHKEEYLNAMNPTYNDYVKWCNNNCQDFQTYNLTKEKLEAIASNNMHITLNTEKTLTALRHAGIRLALVSGGIDVIARTVLGSLLDFFGKDIFINEFQFAASGVLGSVKPTKFDFQGKAECIRLLCSKYDIPRRRTAFIGDSRNDQHALMYAGLGIAFYPTPFSVQSLKKVDFDPSDTETTESPVDKERRNTYRIKSKDLGKILPFIENYKNDPRFIAND